MIALVDYGAGNLRSVENALARLGARTRIAARRQDLAGVEGVIFPGQGAAGPAMKHLKERGLHEALRETVLAGVPFLGICLGLQLLFTRSEEDDTACLDLLPGTVQRLDTPQKLPHIGWNTLERVRPHPVLEGLEGEAFYFVHSYVVVPDTAGVTAAETTYGVPFVSAVAHKNLVAVQFHPERSGRAGFHLLERFLAFAGITTESDALQADHSLS